MKVSSSPENKALTTRQLEVLRLLAQGHSNKSIAAQLGITKGTVRMPRPQHFAQIGHGESHTGRALGYPRRVNWRRRRRLNEPKSLKTAH